jgi:hypothetical protein
MLNYLFDQKIGVYPIGAGTGPVCSLKIRVEAQHVVVFNHNILARLFRQPLIFVNRVVLKFSS